MFENIDALLNIDPTYLALFGAMSLGAVQVIKSISERVGAFALALNAFFSLVFASLLVSYDSVSNIQEYMVSVFVLAYLIASSASGAYSWVKKKVEINLPDYSDDK